MWSLDLDSFLSMDIQSVPTPFVENYPSSIELLLYLCQRSVGYICMGLFFDHFFLLRTSFRSAGDKWSLFLLIWNVLPSPSLLEDIFTGYKILGQEFFSLSTWKILCYFFWASLVSDEKSALIWIAFFSPIGFVFLWLLSGISLWL